ncbi:hypothetical protein Micbo1qcDRAFT_169973 [Microdochium bolleyi]|uniref:Uncharacterized protein n=1 Tax=Microdochium bolleyi TaxID=196109 RepID=A0A136IIJ0_9PEZI|nr:hypothetical protein Micbo1qcDRAFT_169973 [Microdochium bolleyi]
MRTAPEGEALDILFRLRASGDAQSVLESSRGSMSRQYQPSAIQAARTVSLQAFSMLEFKMSTRRTTIPRKHLSSALGEAKYLEARYGTIRVEKGAGPRDRGVKRL